jgi:septum formation protein
MMHSALILASASPVRRAMLEEVGLVFTVMPSPYDEDAQKEQLRHLPPAEQAARLAAGKAEAVSVLHPEAYVIGADQICAIPDGTILGKPHTEERALSHLQQLQGKVHYQHSAACIYHAGRSVWETVETVTLTMKPLDDAAIRTYIATDMPLAACGAYCFEKTGHTLFSHVEGSAAAIKGLPLDGLLNAWQLFS